MTQEPNASGEATLSIDQAAAALTEVEKKEGEAPAAETAEAEESSEDGEATADGGEMSDTAEEPDPLDPPQFWSAADKARFGELPRGVQEVVLRHEQQRSAATSRALQEAAEKRKAADGETARLAQVMGALDSLVPQAVEAFRNRWETLDWNQVVDEYGADAALKLKNDMEREQAMLAQLGAARQDAERIRFTKFVEAESGKLADLCPDLADGAQGPSRRAALGRFLVETGVPPHVIPHMTALEASLAYDAMQWRQAKANATKLAAKASTTSARPSLKPTAAPAHRHPQSARLQQLKSKRSLTVDEAVELANLTE
jgi:hypothetical protein